MPSPNRNRPHEADLAVKLRNVEREIARLRLIIARALTHLPGRPDVAERILSEAEKG